MLHALVQHLTIRSYLVLRRAFVSILLTKISHRVVPTQFFQANLDNIGLGQSDFYVYCSSFDIANGRSELPLM